MQTRALSMMAVLAFASAAAVPEVRAQDDGATFAATQLYIEFNSTDGDAGVQVFLDAEGWNRLSMSGPGGQQILDIEAAGGLGELGLTELFFEGAEPSPDEVLAAFPEGEYRFKAATVEGGTLEGTSTLSHDLPAAPVFSPSGGETVDPDNTVITWGAIPGVASYQVIVENEDLGTAMTVDLAASETSLQVPPQLLEPGTEYQAEVVAISENGNRTITEGTFTTM